MLDVLLCGAPASLHEAQYFTDRQDLVWLKLWVGNVRFDLLDNCKWDVVLVKGPQALEKVWFHQHLFAGLHRTTYKSGGCPLHAYFCRNECSQM